MSTVPTALHAPMASSIARSCGSSEASKPGSGGGSGIGVPRRLWSIDLRDDVRMRRAASSVSAANTLNPAMA